MNVLFLTLPFSTSKVRSSYEELLRMFINDGHSVYVACANERNCGEKPGFSVQDGLHVLRVPTGRITGDIPFIEKGISTLMVDHIFQRAVRKQFKGIKFDLIMYPTPPITLVNTIQYFKNKMNAHTYLLLKDIFPQNAVDLGMMTKSGVKGFLYYLFRKKEKKLYSISDYIGCMSPANVEYVLKNNPELSRNKVEVCPNCTLAPQGPNFIKNNQELKTKYNIPEDAVIFLYGGNLGKPQGIPFLIECLRNERNNKRAFFIIVGQGTEYGKIQHFIDSEQPKNVVLINYLPYNEYKKIADQSDVGLILLDHRFTIPNYPSRLLAYQRAGMPIISATDPNTDIGTIARDNGYGFCCESNDVDGFSKAVNDMINADRVQMGKNAWKFFLENYTTEIGYNIIMKHFENK